MRYSKAPRGDDAKLINTPRGAVNSKMSIVVFTSILRRRKPCRFVVWMADDGQRYVLRVVVFIYSSFEYVLTSFK